MVEKWAYRRMVSRENKSNLRFKKIEPREYDVYFGEIRIGHVYYDEDAWSWGRWFVGGISQDMEWGGVNSMTLKAEGFSTRIQSANHLAKMNSFKVIRGSDD